MYEAKIIKDSICYEQRLTTMQVTHPRIIHSEFMTHAMFARNASSSRAIPVKVMLERVKTDPFIPIYWGKNQKGMQAAEELKYSEIKDATKAWLDARDNAITVVEYMVSILDVHKQIANRLLEPFGWITVCVTGDAGAWSNYFALRCHRDAQPEIRKQAEMAAEAYYESTPNKLKRGEWHLPYVDHAEFLDLNSGETPHIDDLVKISVGRCARTSYLTQEGKHDLAADITLHDRLRNAVPMHASPFEHVCQAQGNKQRYGKYMGWKAYRHMIANEYVTDWKIPVMELTNVKTKS